MARIPPDDVSRSDRPNQDAPVLASGDVSEQAAASDWTPEQQRVIERLRRLGHLLDSQFTVPGIGYRVGLDGLIGLVPGVGDTLTLALSAYIIIEAQKLNVSAATTARMIGNVLIDYVIGAIPVIGDLFDFAFKANQRNLRLLGIESEGS